VGSFKKLSKGSILLKTSDEYSSKLFAIAKLLSAFCVFPVRVLPIAENLLKSEVNCAVPPRTDSAKTSPNPCGA